MDVKGVLLQWFIIYLIKRFVLLADKCASGNEIKKENISNQELVAEFQKTIIKKFQKRKAHSSFINNTCGDDLADM